MAKEVSKTQIDRLGNRLKSGSITEEDLRLLDQYRRSFTDAYEAVVRLIRGRLGLEPTGRPAKSTTSIADKLKRESIRLTQIQDIAGCRLVVADIAEQESVIQSLADLFQQATIVDRREKPSHGYRAVHVVVNYGEKLIEIQVRTSLQHVWAEMSEKLSDVLNPSIKYGGGIKLLQTLLQAASNDIATEEGTERKVINLLSLSSSNKLPNDVQQMADEVQETMKQRRQLLYNGFQKAIDEISKLGEEL